MWPAALVIMLLVQVGWAAWLLRMDRRLRDAEKRMMADLELSTRPAANGFAMRVYDVMWNVAQSSAAFLELEAGGDADALHADVTAGVVDTLLVDGAALLVAGSSRSSGGRLGIDVTTIGGAMVFGADTVGALHLDQQQPMRRAHFLGVATAT
jgi:hypothetical protein